ncbi:MAG: hypothetical protein K2G64_07940, partial [Muribaculaceae bacterium]|nr:hypothetical protein [Muribaculaceae bacterium]
IESLPISSNCSIVNPTEIIQAEGVFKKNEDYARLSRLLLRRGQSEYVNNQFSESLEDFFTALLYIENFNIKSLEAQCYYRIAVVLKKLNFYADSWSFANKCVSSLQEDVESVKYKIESTLLLAEYETNAGNYHESIKLLNSLKTRQGIDNADINDKISALLIVPYFKMGYSKKAFEIFQDMKSRDSSFIYSELSPIVVASLLRENGEFAEAKDFIANYIERDGTCSQPHYSKCLTIPGSDSIVIYDNSLILEGELFTPDNVHLSPLQTFKTSQVKFFEQHDNPFFTKQSARKSIFLIAFFVIMISLIVLISIKYRYVNYQKKLSDEVSMDKSELQFKTEVALKSINQSRVLLNKLCDEYYEKKDCKNLNVSLQKILEKEISVMRTSRFQESLIQEINNLYSNAIKREYSEYQTKRNLILCLINVGSNSSFH